MHLAILTIRVVRTKLGMRQVSYWLAFRLWYRNANRANVLLKVADVYS
jgi:hypothetical protein